MNIKIYFKVHFCEKYKKAYLCILTVIIGYMHKNNNEAIGNYGIYEIVVFEKTYKIGKADIDRITLTTNSPTRIHQQVKKLAQKYGKENVMYRILKTLFGFKTKEAKLLEFKILQLIYEQQGNIPEGNLKSFKSKKNK